MCRSRRELSNPNSNEYLLAKIGVDTAENEPLEVWGKLQLNIHSPPRLPRPGPGRLLRQRRRARLGGAARKSDAERAGAGCVASPWRASLPGAARLGPGVEALQRGCASLR